MKKQIIIATLALGAFVVGTNNVNAQVSDEATTVVNIILADVISIDTPGTEITFTYPTAASYNADQTHSMADNLTVTSTRNFGITVRANAENFVNGAFEIPVNVLTIMPVAGGTKPMGGTQTDVNLTELDQPLVSAALLGSEVTLNVDYFIPLAKSSSSDILGKESGTYTQTVTYTATTL